MTKSQRKSKSAPERKQPGKLALLLTILGAFLLLVGLMFAFRKPAAQATPEVRGGPGLKVDREKVDLGDVKLGQPVTVSFKLTNVGDQPLKITDTPYVEVLEGC